MMILLADFQRIVLAGGQPREHSWLSNEEGYATADMESDQLHVPADLDWFWNLYS